MSLKPLRRYQLFDIKQIKEHLLIYGDLGGQCAHCQHMDIKLDETHCPDCGHEFKYISFRNIRSNMSKVFKMLEQRPEIHVIDFDDYTYQIGSLKADEFFK